MIVLNDKKVVFGTFPNKEINLKIADLYILESSIIKWTYEDDGDFFKLATVKHYLDEMNVTTSLIINYMPYSRMDRVNGVYVVTCPIACELINNMFFTSVHVREPHSGVCMSNLSKACQFLWTAEWLPILMVEDRWDSVFFPDEGAKGRYKVDSVYRTGWGTKRRKFESGIIEQYSIVGEVGDRVLIVDDLCSRGGTFVAAAKLLKAQGAKHVGLLVAMCEENVHTGELFNYIDRLYTSKDCILTPHPRIILL